MAQVESNYKKILKEVCCKLKLDYFPQVEASDLLYKVITLEDIYLPLTLSLTASEFGMLHHDLNIDEIIRRVNEKLSALEENSENIEELEKKRTITKGTQDDLDLLKLTLHNQFLSEPLLLEKKTDLRLLIEANPGGGKTTFCKRLILAMINHDISFFVKYSKENDLYFNLKALPILICCKNIANLTIEDISCLNFKQLMYKLCEKSYGALFSEITEAEFFELIDSNEPNNLCFIFDGWDEILDTEKEIAFCNCLNNYLIQQPHVDTIITIRSSYAPPELFKPYTAHFNISPLTNKDIREFCKKWSEIILSTNQQQASGQAQISRQILNSNNEQIKAMMRNPLDLSLLLTISKNDGHLPDNKAELFKRIVDLYIFWSINKGSTSLSAKSIRVFLAYIASYFTKNNRLYCWETELLQVIRQGIADLEWAFSEDIATFDPTSIAKDLSHTNILTSTYDGRLFSFSEGGKATHRQMQEYLTAYAIVAQYSDEEYNNMSPIDIFEDKYERQSWREVIIFIALMNNGRLRHEIIKRLILKSEEDPRKNHIYHDLLFDFIVNGAEIANKHEIYHLLFANQITSSQISKIYLFVTSQSKCSNDFITYIDSMFTKSVESGNSEYGLAQAIVLSSLALQKGVSPFKTAESLMLSKAAVDVIAGSQILLIMAWSKYAALNNEFTPYLSHYKMTPECVGILKQLIENQRFSKDCLKSIQESVLAGFATFNDFFNTEKVVEICSNINNTSKAKDCEMILSIAPVFDSSYQHLATVDNQVKEKYLNKLNSEIDKRDFESIIFSFSICSMLGCFTAAQQNEKWDEINTIYRNIEDDDNIGKVRYKQLERMKKTLEMSNGQEIMDVATTFPVSPSETASFTVLDKNGKEVKCDVLFTFDSEETGKSYVVYTDNTHDEDGDVQVFASSYVPDANSFKLEPIESEKEWKIIEIILDKLQASIRAQATGSTD